MCNLLELDCLADITRESIILNNVIEKPQHIFNTLILLTKQYLYRKRCLKNIPNIGELQKEIITTHNVEKYLAIQKGSLYKHSKKWSPVNMTRLFRKY